MAESAQNRAEQLKELANRKLGTLDRRLLHRRAESLAEALRDDERPTTVGQGGLEGGPEAFVLVTESGLVIASATDGKAAFIQRLPYKEIEEIRVETPGLGTRWRMSGSRQAHLAIRTRGETIRLKLLELHRAEEIRDLVEARQEW